MLEKRNNFCMFPLLRSALYKIHFSHVTLKRQKGPLHFGVKSMTLLVGSARQQ